MPERELIITIQIKRRSFVERVFLLPSALKSHYKIFRKHHGVLTSIYAAFLLSGVLLRVK